MRDIGSFTIEELTAFVEELGEKKYRASQIYSWIHEKRVFSFEDMTNLSKSLRQKLSQEARLDTLYTERVLVSEKDGTRKYLFKAHDGAFIESVLMRYEYGLSVCVSTQVGCRMGCAFCASAIGGRLRDLTAYEILSQIYSIASDIKERVSHVVFMGMGEPFDNYDNVIRALRLLTDEKGYGLSSRNITLSTCGVVPGITRFANEGIPVTLALSLHATNQSLRETIMPIAKKYALDEVIKACLYYYKKTGRRVTFEYALIDSVNDSDENARQMKTLSQPLNAHINIIPVNPVEKRNDFKSSKEAAGHFKKKLEKYGINATIRRETGRDIKGACGQLRHEYLEGSYS